jgi:hypothetical protein
MLEDSIEDDFKQMVRNQAIGSQYFRDVAPTMPGFLPAMTGLPAFRVQVNPSLFQPAALLKKA